MSDSEHPFLDEEGQIVIPEGKEDAFERVAEQLPQLARKLAELQVRADRAKKLAAIKRGTLTVRVKGSAPDDGAQGE